MLYYSLIDPESKADRRIRGLFFETKMEGSDCDCATASAYGRRVSRYVRIIGYHRVTLILSDSGHDRTLANERLRMRGGGKLRP